MFVKLMTTHHRYCNKSSKSFEIRVNSECNLSKKKQTLITGMRLLEFFTINPFYFLVLGLSNSDIDYEIFFLLGFFTLIQPILLIRPCWFPNDVWMIDSLWSV